MTLKSLLTRIGHSPYLADLRDKYPEDCATLKDLQNLAHKSLKALENLQVDQADFGERLLEIKDRFALGWSAQSLTQSASFETLGDLQSLFAARTINKALQAAWHLEAKALKMDVKANPLKGLTVFGLGKLGGFDLNFSSDVDLIAFYDPEIFPVPVHRGQGHISHKILQTMTQFLKPRAHPNFVWRVDWRLRPEASTRQLAMTYEMAEAFYFFRALPWHRLALMKARPIAGDIDRGEVFLETITPFIWRKNLDYRTLDELAHLKSRINLEHPTLSQERAQSEPILEDPSGFNVKLGRGGIREIEFIANGQQLIWGGRQHDLRTPNTLKALERLSQFGKIDQKFQTKLCAIYKRHRKIENVIQMLENQQTHLIPNDEDKHSALAKLLGIDWSELSAQIYSDRKFVSEEFRSLFDNNSAITKEEPPSQSGTKPYNLVIDSVLETLSPTTRETVNMWLSGFQSMRNKRDYDALFVELGRKLVSTLLESHIEPEEAIIRVQAFLKDVSRSEQYLHLLARHDTLVKKLIPPLIHSPHMTTLLQQSPHIIDIFLTPQSGMNTDFIFANPDFETRLERLRRFVNENLFQFYTAFMQPHTEGESVTPAILHKNLTLLAETTLQAALKIVQEDMSLDELPISVIGMGNLGSKLMAPQSDLDLIFIFNDEVDTQLSHKIVRKLRTILTAKMSEGVAYDLDMRLRPSGRSGPPAVFLSSFEEHHNMRARNWEHIALLLARPVAGDARLGKKVMDIKSQILARPRDRAQFLSDASAMWERISTQRLSEVRASDLNSKLRHGGLMQAEFIQACHRILDKNTKVDLGEHIQFWSSLQLWERLLGLTAKPVSEIPQFYAGQIAAHFDITNLTKIEGLQARHVKSVLEQNEALFAELDKVTNHEETRVIWTD